MFITACKERENTPQSVYDIRLYTKSPATKNYMELWGGATAPPPPLDPPLDNGHLASLDLVA